MQDRVPTKPNRYAVYDDAHNFLRYEHHERADEPAQEGSALNKANLLPDDVCTLLGISTTSEPKDALKVIDTVRTTANSKAQITTGSYTGTGTYGADNPNSLVIPANTEEIVIYSKYDSALGSQLARFYPQRLDADFHDRMGELAYTSTGNVISAIYAKRVNNTLSWHHTSAVLQLNASGITYYWIAKVRG